MSKKTKAVEDAVRFIEIYKAGFKDGFEACKKKKVTWKSIYRRCKKAWESRMAI